MHYYQFNIGDYASHTRHLSLIEDLAYRRLLDIYYLHERPLNDCSATVARLIGMAEYQEQVETVLVEFFEHIEGGFVNPRADKEISHFHSKLEQASRAGKASAQRRLSERSTGVQPTNNHKPITNNQIKEKATSVAFVLPDWVPKETWEQFLEMRKRIKKPPTDYAIKLLIDKLSRFRSNGQDIKLVLEKSITSGWQDVFEIKGNPADNIRTTVPPSNEPDPALIKIIEDAKKATPMPDHIRQAMAQLRSKS